MESETFTNVAVFILKLWKMLNHDEAAKTLMSWNSTGTSFIIYNKVLFITKLLPSYFKHNNMGSFIRQLNLYDFHKVCNDKSTELEYQHRYFQRDRPDLLKHIKRKLPRYKSRMNHEQLKNLDREVSSLKKKQEELDKQLSLQQKDNVALKKELSNLCVKYNSQNRVLKKLMEIVPFVESYKWNASSRNEAAFDGGAKIFEFNEDLVKKLDAISRSNMNNGVDQAPIDYFKKSSLNFQDNVDASPLQLCAASHPETHLVKTIDTLSSPNTNQSVVLYQNNSDHFHENSHKAYKDELDSLENDLTNLLDSDLLDVELLGTPNTSE